MFIIYTKFKNLTKQKQQVIINSAIEEFVRNGFDDASTNEIVLNANISKGSLFNYFRSKKDLYLYLISWSIQIMESFYKKVDLTEHDLFKRIENVGQEKLKVQLDFPLVFDFLKSCIQEDNQEIKNEINESVNEIYNKGLKKIYKNIDYSNFKDNIDVDKAIEILNWTMFGFGEKSIAEIDSFKNSEDFGQYYIKEWNKYAEILKQTFYK